MRPFRGRFRCRLQAGPAGGSAPTTAGLGAWPGSGRPGCLVLPGGRLPSS